MYEGSLDHDHQWWWHRLSRDPQRSRSRIGQDRLRDARLPKVEMRVFQADHTLQDEELAALAAWWLA
jgi:hypothetical protein